MEGHRVVWTLCFEPSVFWWARLLEPGFGHVWAIRDDGEAYTYVNPASSFTQAGFIKKPADLDELIGDAQIVTVERWIHDLQGVRVPWLFGTVSCVEVVKGLLGLSAPWIITPHQLWRWANETAEAEAHRRRTEPPAHPG